MSLEKLLGSGKNFFKRVVLATAVTAASLITAACPIIPPVPPTPPNSGPNAFGGATYALNKEDSEAITRVTNNEIYFTNPVEYLKKDDILASDITPSTPYGFLRKVTGISPDKKIIYTEQAALEDAVENVDFEFSAILSPNGARVLSPAESRSLEWEIDLIDRNFNVDINNIPILDFDGNPNNIPDVSADAHANLGLKVILGGKIEDYTFKRFEFRTIVSEGSDLTLKANILMTVLNKEVTIGEPINLPPFTIGYLPLPAPPIPITLNPRIEFVVGADGYVGPALVTRIGKESSLNVGILYENGQWNLINEFEKNFEFDPPYFSHEMEIKAYVGAKLKMPVWGVAGPYGKLLGFLRLGIDLRSGYALWDWDLYGGLEASLGVDVKAFGHTFVDFSTTLLDEEWLLASGSGTGEEPEPPTNPPVQTGEKILFVSGREGIVYDSDYAQIYLMDSNGSNLTNLTNFRLLFNDYQPCWSPDGNKIAFVSIHDGNRELYTMNLDGSRMTRLTNNSVEDVEPDWSPNGQEIVFSADNGPSTSRNLYLINADGGTPTKINIPSFGGIERGSPRWSPNGNKIAFDATETGSNYEIYTINKDGTGLQKLTSISGLDILPAWSPDGNKIAFSSTRDGNREIYIMNSDGTNPIRLTNNLAVDSCPEWSRDGTKIFFISSRNQYNQLHVMNAVNGLDVHRIATMDYYHDDYPRISPVPIQP